MERFVGFKSKREGFSHLKSGTPCQDAVDYFCDKYAVCVAADGHGSEKYFRSKTGAEIVVEVAIRATKEFIDNLLGMDENEQKESVKDENKRNKLLKGLSSCIVSRWVDEIGNDWNTSKCDDKEEEIFKKYFTKHDPTDKDLNLTKIYGTTLIIGAITENFAFVIQCGDGGACIILENGDTQIARDTFDENQLGGMTNSLSSSNCLNTFRYFYTEDIVEAMFLVSDGVLESYGGNEGRDFLRFCEKLYDVFSKDYEQAKTFLDEWMPKLSERGNEDDVSIAGVYRQKDNDAASFSMPNTHCPLSEGLHNNPDVDKYTLPQDVNESDSRTEYNISVTQVTVN